MFVHVVFVDGPLGHYAEIKIFCRQMICDFFLTDTLSTKKKKKKNTLR